jgi:Leucine-rich repeat (LRR) protein
LRANKLTSFLVAIEDLSNLEHLNLGENEFESLDGFFREPNRVITNPKLKTLGLRFNLLQELPANSFARFPSLRALNLSSNLTQISNEAFAGLVNLRKLDFGGNPLKVISRSLFSTVPNLMYLMLDQGYYDLRIDSIEEGAFSHFKMNPLHIGLPRDCENYEILKPFESKGLINIDFLG